MPPSVDCTGVNFDVALYCILGTAALGNTLRGVGWLGGDQGQGERRCECYTALVCWCTAAALVVATAVGAEGTTSCLDSTTAVRGAGAAAGAGAGAPDMPLEIVFAKAFLIFLELLM